MSLTVLSILLGGLVVVGAVWWLGWRKQTRSESVPTFARTESDNSAQAMYEQGMAYRRGEELELDFQAAWRLLRRAAEMQHPQAQYEFGIMMESGLGGEQDQAKGLRWIMHAAKNGSLEARLLMGRRYLNGDGVEKNLARAEQYLRGAAVTGNAEAQLELGLLYRDSAPPLANPTLAAEWLSKAAARRNPSAMFAMSDLYERGLGVERDLKKADELLLQAAEFGETAAQMKIGRYYLTGAFGHAFPQNYRTAREWFQRAASRGLAEAEYEIGVRYERNEGVDAPDMGRAIASYLKAAQMGFAPAQYRMGHVYLYGQGANQNLPEALRWFEAAAAQGYAGAARQVEKMQGRVSTKPITIMPAPMDAALNSDHGPEWKG